MLFRKKIDRFCSYCVYAGKLDDETYLCAKRGFVAACHHCRKFKYDPLKRVPKRRKPKDFRKFYFEASPSFYLVRIAQERTLGPFLLRFFCKTLGRCFWPRDSWQSFYLPAAVRINRMMIVAT